MIKTKTIKLKKINNFDNLYIEQELKNLGLELVRWAIVDITDEVLALTVSYVD